jgi:sulfotransferase
LLAQAPAKVIPLIYRFLGEPEFAHDYENLDYQEPEFDARIGVQGLHEVKRKVALRPRQTVLPPDLFKQYSQLDFWRNHEGSLAHVINATPAASPSAGRGRGAPEANDTFAVKNSPVGAIALYGMANAPQALGHL